MALDCFVASLLAMTTEINSTFKRTENEIRTESVQRAGPASASIASLTAAANWPADAANIKRDSS